MGETPTVQCAICGATAQRIMSAPMIHTQYYFSPQVRGARRPRHRSAEKREHLSPAEPRQRELR
jgi:hypothetical protein